MNNNYSLLQDIKNSMEYCNEYHEEKPGDYLDSLTKLSTDEEVQKLKAESRQKRRLSYHKMVKPLVPKGKKGGRFTKIRTYFSEEE